MLLTVTFNLQSTRTLCRSTRLSGEEASRKEKSDTKSDEKEKRNTRKKENTDIGQGTSSGSAKRASTGPTKPSKVHNIISFYEMHLVRTLRYFYVFLSD